jgi:predicted TIM-barrel fold metal-dependent hydrolase
MKNTELMEKLKSGKALIDSHTHVGISRKFYLQKGYPYALSLEDLLIRMDVLGIDYNVVFPFVDSVFYKEELRSSVIETTDKYCQFPYEMENANLLNEINEVFKDSRQKVLPFLMFDPSRETERQAAFMKELAEKYPVYGLKTATTYIQAFINDLENKGKAILDFVRKNNLPIIFHSAVHPDDPWASVYDIVDFAERHPDIRVCIAHSARFVEPVLEKAAKLNNCFVDLSAFIIHCELARQDSPAVAEQSKRFSGDYHNPLSVMTDLAKTYPDTLIWGSDTPFYYWIQKYYSADGTLIEDNLRCSFNEEKKLLDELAEDIKYKIAYENSLRFIFGDEE